MHIDSNQGRMNLSEGNYYLRYLDLVILEMVQHSTENLNFAVFQRFHQSEKEKKNGFKRLQNNSFIQIMHLFWCKRKTKVKIIANMYEVNKIHNARTVSYSKLVIKSYATQNLTYR